MTITRRRAPIAQPGSANQSSDNVCAHTNTAANIAERDSTIAALRHELVDAEKARDQRIATLVQELEARTPANAHITMTHAVRTHKRDKSGMPVAIGRRVRCDVARSFREPQDSHYVSAGARGKQACHNGRVGCS